MYFCHWHYFNIFYFLLNKLFADLRFCRWLLHCLPHDVPLFTNLYFCHWQFQYFSCNYIFAARCWICCEIYIFAAACCIDCAISSFVYKLHFLSHVNEYIFYRFAFLPLAISLFAAWCLIVYKFVFLLNKIFTICFLPLTIALLVAWCSIVHNFIFTFFPLTISIFSVITFLPRNTVLFLPHTVLHVHILPLGVTVALFVHYQH